jgi:hypothetical protein
MRSHTLTVRNTYTLINYGSAVGTRNPQFDQNAQGFIQILPTTEPSKMHDEFVASRARGASSTSSNATSPGTAVPSTRPTNGAVDSVIGNEYIRYLTALTAGIVVLVS